MRKLVFLFPLFLIISAVSAQSELCPAIVDLALASIDQICTPLNRNMACYGASVVESVTVEDPRPQNFFEQPGDRAQLVALREIRPLPLDEDERSIGTALMSVQANVPNTLPGQAVLFLLIGDARFTNEVDADSDEQTPFQSFYFLPGTGASTCYEAEPILTIQTPGNMSVTIVLNGVETEMSPGTLLTITPHVCTIHRGNIIQGEGENQAVLLANQTIDIFIDDEGAVNVTNLRGISEREYIRGQAIQQAINALASENDWQEQFVSPPREFDVEPPRINRDEATSTDVPDGCETQHTVQRGETLARIAARYGLTVQDITRANQIANPNLIQVGQVLCIPG